MNIIPPLSVHSAEICLKMDAMEGVQHRCIFMNRLLLQQAIRVHCPRVGRRLQEGL